MRFWGVFLSLLVTGCYDRPAIPLDRPLVCRSADPAECPVGFSCVANRICALAQCSDDSECPLGLVCTSRDGCGLPVDGGVTDAGADLADADTMIVDGGGS